MELYNKLKNHKNYIISPTNKFVAKFLGNPPINILHGEIKNSHLTIDGHVIYPMNVPFKTVEVGIRPEAFMVDEKGFPVHIDNMETIGRDTLIRFILGRSTSSCIY